MIAQVTGL